MLILMNLLINYPRLTWRIVESVDPKLHKARDNLSSRFPCIASFGLEAGEPSEQHGDVIEQDIVNRALRNIGVKQIN